MTPAAIEVDRLGKRYRIGRAPMRRRVLVSELAAAAASAVGVVRRSRAARPAAGSDHLWALRNVSFHVGTGETVGIIGANGAGKSTLLRILARITSPTEGSARLRGRVGALLEVGAGFHPELTGRENVFLSGSILGLDAAFLRHRFDEIVEFAGVARHIDTPVKRYSSGMYLRLAFAVAAHMEPEVLVVDEVLAVGDAEFQRRCLGKLKQVGGEGRTVLFVSHNMVAVQSLCRTAIHMDNGSIVESGPARSVVATYLSRWSQARAARDWSGDAGARSEAVRLLRSSAVPLPSNVPAITVRTPVQVRIEYELLREVRRLNLSLFLYDAEDTLIMNVGPIEPRRCPAGSYAEVCTIPADLLNDGYYRVGIALIEDLAATLFSHDDAVSFEVLDSEELRGGWYDRWPGVVRPRVGWHIHELDSPPALAVDPSATGGGGFNAGE